jgi:hypothetical protein
MELVGIVTNTFRRAVARALRQVATPLLPAPFAGPGASFGQRWNQRRRHHGRHDNCAGHLEHLLSGTSPVRQGFGQVVDNVIAHVAPFLRCVYPRHGIARTMDGQSQSKESEAGYAATD